MTASDRGRAGTRDRDVAPSVRRHWVLGGLALLGVIGAVVLSLLGGTQRPLPGVALGEPALLYAERAGAAFTVYLLALIVVIRAFVEGTLPDKVRGLGYNLRETRDETARAIEDLAAADEWQRERIEAIEALLEVDEVQ